MEVRIIALPADRITDWATFHTVCSEVFGFPGYYGHNMDAWIDCLSYVDEPDTGMCEVSIPPGGLLVIRVDAAADLKRRCPEQHDALVECTAFVNHRRIEAGEAPILALQLSGDY